jgi:hypothetical protein
VSDIAIVTCRVLPEPDPDQIPLLEACEEAGLAVEMAAWDDAGVDWSKYRAAVLHSCWNYYEDPASFRVWLDRVDALTALWNPLSVVRENLDKRYLANLADQGIPIVPTRYLNNENSVQQVIDQTGWERFVIKPTISAASFMTSLFSRSQVAQAQEFTNEILLSREAMIQPYIESVERGGEVAMVHIDGELTHCVLKDPRFTGCEESVSIGFQPTEAQASAARAVMATIHDKVLYARVDMMEDSCGTWLLSELELVEPTRFLAQHRPALHRFVSALSRL